MTAERTPKASWHAPERRAEMIARLPERDRKGAVIIYENTPEMLRFLREFRPLSKYGSNMVRADREEGTIWMVHFDVRGIIEVEGGRRPDVAGKLADYRIYNEGQWRGARLESLPYRAKTAPVMVLTPSMELEIAMRRCQHILESRSVGEAEVVIGEIRGYIQQFSDRRITERKLKLLYGDFEEFMRREVLTENFRGEDRKRIFELLEMAVRGKDRIERINVMISRNRLNAALLRTVGRSFVEGKIKKKYNSAWAILNVERDLERANLRGVAVSLANIVGHRGYKGHDAFHKEDWALDVSDRVLASQKRAIIGMVEGLAGDTTVAEFEPYRSLGEAARARLVGGKHSVVRMIERNQFARAREEVQGVVGHIAETLRSYENAHIERPTAKAS